MVEFKFHIKMPIYIARQHLRHRTASVNELSARYSVVPKEYYDPTLFRGQSVVNHQGSEGIVEVNGVETTQALEQAFGVYEQLLEQGVCREQARGVLPQSTYTEFYWKINLHNLMHYLQLRLDHHAQQEIREYAEVIYNLIEPLVPITMQAFLDFRVNGIFLTGPEIEAIRTGRNVESPGEQREFEEKKKILGI
jgi:thymidylate synthase (FAD)